MFTKIAVQRYEKFSLHRNFFLWESLFLTIHEADVLPEAVKCLIYYCVIPKGPFATAASVFKTVWGYCDSAMSVFSHEWSPARWKFVLFTMDCFLLFFSKANPIWRFFKVDTNTCCNVLDDWCTSFFIH